MDRIEIHESLESVKLPWEAPQLAAFDIRDATQHGASTGSDGGGAMSLT